VPTLALAVINARQQGGANVHSKPEFLAPIVKILANGWPVEVYPDAVKSEGVIWRKIRTSDGVEGWIWETLILTATPKPGW
jgi:SH3-like domain-containing protein